MIYLDDNVANYMTREHLRRCLMARTVTLGLLWGDLEWQQQQSGLHPVGDEERK